MSAAIGQLAIHVWDNWDIQNVPDTNEKSMAELDKMMVRFANHQTTVLINYLTHRGDFWKKCKVLDILSSL